MEYRVYLSNGLVFRGTRGWRDVRRECPGFHRFRVKVVEKTVDGFEVVGHMVVVSMRLIDLMEELQ